MSRIRRTDANQKQIVRELRGMGYSVRHTHTVGKGFPDIAVGRNGITVLVEIKRPGESLTLDEEEFFEIWRGAAMVAYSSDDVHSAFVKMVTNE